MSVTLIQERLLAYQCQTIVEQENALKEIMQEIAFVMLYFVEIMSKEEIDMILVGMWQEKSQLTLSC